MSHAPALFAALLLGACPPPSGTRDSQLMDAAYRGDVERIRACLDAGADPSYIDPTFGSSPLTSACLRPHDTFEKDYVRTIRILLAAGADVNHADKWGNTALHNAVLDAPPDAVELLLEAGAEVKSKNESGDTPLHNVAHRVRKSTAAVATTLLRAGADVNCADNAGTTPLMWACERGNADAARVFLLHGADLAHRPHTGDLSGVPVLCVAARSCPEVVKMMLDGGASLEDGDPFGGTAIEWAADRRAPTFWLLLDRGARPSKEAANPILNVICGAYGLDATERVRRASAAIAAGADVNARGANGTTALILAATRCHAEAVKLLLGGGADLHAHDAEGLSALMATARSVHYPRQHQYMLELQDAYPGSGAADRAAAALAEREDDQLEIMRALLEAGADAWAKDAGGTRVIEAVAQQGSTRILSLLLERLSFAEHPAVRSQCEAILGARTDPPAAQMLRLIRGNR